MWLNTNSTGSFSAHIIVQLSARRTHFHVMILGIWLISPRDAMRFKKYLVNIKCCWEANPKWPEKCPLSMAMKRLLAGAALRSSFIGVQLQKPDHSWKVKERWKRGASEYQLLFKNIGCEEKEKTRVIDQGRHIWGLVVLFVFVSFYHKGELSMMICWGERTSLEEKIVLAEKKVESPHSQEAMRFRGQIKGIALH